MTMKMKRTFITLLTMCILTMTFVGCGNSSSTDAGKSNTDKTVNNDTIDVKDIDWNVDERSINNTKYLSFNYTNNSNKYVVAVTLKFIPKNKLSNKQFKVFDSVKDKGYGGKKDEVYILGYNLKHANPGETAENTPCMIEDLSFYADSMEQYNLMKPNILKITYAGSDNEIYKIEYDYDKKSTSKPIHVGPAYEWVEDEKSDVLPKPTQKTVTSHINKEENTFYFAMYGATANDFSEYIQKCKDDGFNNNLEKTENEFKADNKKYYLEIGYNSEREKISGFIKTK